MIPRRPDARLPLRQGDLRSLLIGAIYPLAYWTISATAALRSEIEAVYRGPKESRVVWNIPRELEQRAPKG